MILIHKKTSPLSGYRFCCSNGQWLSQFEVSNKTIHYLILSLHKIFQPIVHLGCSRNNFNPLWIESLENISTVMNLVCLRNNCNALVAESQCLKSDLKDINLYDNADSRPWFGFSHSKNQFVLMIKAMPKGKTRKKRWNFNNLWRNKKILSGGESL